MSLLLIIHFFFNDTATTEIYTLSLHDALPILPTSWIGPSEAGSSSASWSTVDSPAFRNAVASSPRTTRDRKSTRLNSSHSSISYAVFCLKKKNNKTSYQYTTQSLSIILHICLT